jgi:hypothetical protein
MLARAIGGGHILINFNGKLDIQKNLSMATLDLTIALSLNPTVFGWDFLLNDLKILKIEQIKFNYGRQFMEHKISSLGGCKIDLIRDALSD